MEVKEIFALRKEKGKAEEAYRAISEIFAVHQGPHTNACLFWCASDLLHQRVREKNADEARRLLGQMVKVYPTINDEDRRATRAISRAAIELDKLVPNFNIIYFMPWFERLTDEDWRAHVINNHYVRPLGQQVANRLMRNIGDRDAAYIEKATNFFFTAMKMQPRNFENRRHLAHMYVALSQIDDAIKLYKNLLRHHHKCYLYWELAQLIDDTTAKTALICQAIDSQSRKKYRAKYHLELAKLLIEQNLLSRAAYELNECISIRQWQKQPITRQMQQLQQRLAGVEPVTAEDEHTLYVRAYHFIGKLVEKQLPPLRF